MPSRAKPEKRPLPPAKPPGFNPWLTPDVSGAGEVLADDEPDVAVDVVPHTKDEMEPLP